MRQCFLFLLGVGFFMSSCSNYYPKNLGKVYGEAPPALDKDTYKMGEDIEYSQNFTSIRILFFGFGAPKKAVLQRDKIYQNAIKSYNIAGILSPKFKTKYFKMPFIPFIPFGFYTYNVTVTGTSYTMRNRNTYLSN